MSGRVSYDAVKNVTTIENEGMTWFLRGNVTNLMLYPEHSTTPRPIPASNFESIYRLGDPQTAIATEYLGQLDGRAYLRITSIPVSNPKNHSEKIVFADVSQFDKSFRDALPPKIFKPL